MDVAWAVTRRDIFSNGASEWIKLNRENGNRVCYVTYTNLRSSACQKQLTVAIPSVFCRFVALPSSL